MRIFQRNGNRMLLCVFELLVGILLLVSPAGFTSTIIRIAGIALLVIGLMETIRYFRTDAQEAALGQMLVKGLLAILIGGFCAFRAQWFLATFPVLTILYGIVILLFGIGKIQQTVDGIRLHYSRWFLDAVNAAISVLCAVVILRNPFPSSLVLWIFTGVTLVTEGIFDLIALFLVKKIVEEEEKTNGGF